MRQSHRETFTTIKTEGALLPVEILQRIAEGDRDLEGLSPESYHLSKNEKLNEAINRAWNRCEGAWRSFQATADILPKTDAGTTLTRERWLLILFQELGYGRLLISKAQQINGKSYPISHAWHHSPIHLIGFRQDLDRRTPGVAGAARMSPHSLMQEFLNRSDDHLWGVVSNGLMLRLLRDNFSLTRQAYVEFDLQAMMSGEVYSDFILLYMILHQSRVETERPEQCWLERWTQEAQRRGTRALDQLRKWVQQAIQTLGQGFLAHPANSTLRQKLQSGMFTPHGLYEQLLRLVYRMIFLFVAEDRDLLLGTDTPPEARSRYMDHYSITRIRRIAGRLRGTQHGDLWQSLRVTFRCLIHGQEALGLAPLGGFLFSEDALADLNDCDLSNDALLTAVRHLSFTRDRRMLRPVDYRNLGTEELGSVYESLLELHPEVNVAAYSFELAVAAGSERKTTGSYYTPSSLIMCLLDSALEPVIASTLKKPDPEKALLDLKVVDPACGSGHFLIAAAHRIGKHLAIVRTGEIEPPPEERRKALRDVVSHCIYGVDVNPLAVELCKVALWIETLDPGRPLGFLDHRIKCGNSLIGTTPELLEKGVPDDAFKPVEGDDKKVATAIRKKNKRERRGERDLFAGVTAAPDWQEAVEGFQAWGSMPENAFHQVCEKATQYETLRDKPVYRHEKQVADLWAAAFFWPLTEKTVANVPTEDLFRRFQESNFELKAEMRDNLEGLVEKHRFFHWHLEFPEVFTTSSNTFPPLVGGIEGGGGFDCVLGNPPWERLNLEARQFFALLRPDIASAPTSHRNRMIEQLSGEDPQLFHAYNDALRQATSEIAFCQYSGRYPHLHQARLNTYVLFVELDAALCSGIGRCGIIVPSGVATDDTCRHLFSFLIRERRLASLFDFENRQGIFEGVHRSYRFCLLTLSGFRQLVDNPDFVFFAHFLEDISLKTKRFRLTVEDMSLLSPITGLCPTFRDQRDKKIVLDIHHRISPFVVQKQNKTDWLDSDYLIVFRSASSSHLYRKPEDFGLDNSKPQTAQTLKVDGSIYWAVWEAKLIHQFDHRYATYEGVSPDASRTGKPREVATEEKEGCWIAQPRFWVIDKEIRRIFDKRNWANTWIGGYRDITNATNERTALAAILPEGGAAQPLNLFLPESAAHAALWVAGMNSFVLDYVVRQSIAGVHLNITTCRQLPIIGPATMQPELHEQIMKYVIELTYTSPALTDFASELGYGGPPFPWNEHRRLLLRCELDATYFHLYGIEREDVDYIMESFPIVKRKDEQKHGEYRTKRVILECYDAVAEAMKTGRPYQTILDPPPADPSVAHPQRKEQLR